jgi:hypothetical protein
MLLFYLYIKTITHRFYIYVNDYSSHLIFLDRSSDAHKRRCKAHKEVLLLVRRTSCPVPSRASVPEEPLTRIDTSLGSLYIDTSLVVYKPLYTVQVEVTFLLG